MNSLVISKIVLCEQPLAKTAYVIAISFKNRKDANNYFIMKLLFLVLSLFSSDVKALFWGFCGNKGGF